ncbi:hypothetical protein QTP88_009063 [Uroleucon formosanum]
MTDSSYNSPARSYGSPARSLKMLDRVYGSPARSYCGDHSSATESEGEETLELLTEIPSSPDQTILDGWLKFRDNKKWRHRWGVMTKLSPAAGEYIELSTELGKLRWPVSDFHFPAVPFSGYGSPEFVYNFTFAVVPLQLCRLSYDKHDGDNIIQQSDNERITTCE